VKDGKPLPFPGRFSEFEAGKKRDFFLDEAVGCITKDGADVIGPLSVYRQGLRQIVNETLVKGLRHELFRQADQ
jgi:hypothetical protein